MEFESTLYWFVRCDRCGQAVTAHAMSLEREAMLCMACLVIEDSARHAARQEARDAQLQAAWVRGWRPSRAGGDGAREVAA